MTSIIKSILTSFLLLILTLAYADTVKELKSKQDSILLVSKSPLTEIDAYKMLYENQVKANDSVLKTIYYALGALGSAMLLVFASNWWFNDKKVRDVINEIDNKIKGVKNDAFLELAEKINSLSNEKTTEINQIQTKLQEEVTITITALTLRFTEFTEKIRAEIKEDNNHLVNNYHELLKNYSDNLTQQISSLKITLEERIKLISQEVEKNKKEQTALLTEVENNVKRDILEHRADIYFLEGHYNNSLKCYIDLGLLEFKLKNTWRFKYTSREIIKCLNKVTSIYDDELNSLDALLKISIEKFPEETIKVKNISLTKPTKKLGT